MQILDDFREAYYWLWQNTAEDARVMSWWDYGYQVFSSPRIWLSDRKTPVNMFITTPDIFNADIIMIR